MDNSCFFCGKKSIYIIGVALGFSGWDYGFCETCLNKKTIKELADKILRKGENDKGMDQALEKGS